MKKENMFRPPKIWEDGAVFIIGGGTSINDIDFGPIQHYRFIGVNNAYKMGDWVDICWFGD
jgi:hypothetical protein